jgi:hypothetical protein
MVSLCQRSYTFAAAKVQSGQLQRVNSRRLDWRYRSIVCQTWLHGGSDVSVLGVKMIGWVWSDLAGCGGGWDSASSGISYVDCGFVGGSWA